MGNDMWVGMLPPQDFMEAFMDKTSVPVPKLVLSSVHGKQRKDKYRSIVRAIHTVFPDLPLHVTDDIRTSSEKEPSLSLGTGFCMPSSLWSGYVRGPVATKRQWQGVAATQGNNKKMDISPFSQNNPFDWNTHGLIVEFQSAAKDDPFYEVKKGGNSKQLPRVARTDDESNRTLTQIAHRVGRLFNQQHRTHAFQLFICGCTARFMYWDRAGSIVSDKFDFRRQPEILATFLSRYENMSISRRGWDTTVIEPSAEEVAVFRAGVEHLLADMNNPESSQRQIAGADQTLDDDYRPYKVAIKAGSTGSSQELIVQKPFQVSHEPTGQGTRAYIAWSLEEKRIVFLKDSWRIKGPDKLNEDVIYTKLMSLRVPCIPVVLCAGDVCSEGGIQTTRVYEIARQEGLTLRYASLKTSAYAHHRVVQELAYSLSTSRNPKEYATAFRDAFATLSGAYACGVLHRDLAFDNIMMGADGLVIVIDWDHAGICRQVRHSGMPRAGTQPFMSIALLKDPSKDHGILDDYESLFWSKLYGALRYFSANATLDFGYLFDREVVNTEDGGSRAVGGDLKASKLEEDGLETLGAVCAPLRGLLDHVRLIWRDYYRLKSNVLKHPNKLRKRYEKMCKKLLKSTFWYRTINHFVQGPGWEDSDAAKDRYPLTNDVKVEEQFFTVVAGSKVEESLGVDVNDKSDSNNQDADVVGWPAVVPSGPASIRPCGCYPEYPVYTAFSYGSLRGHPYNYRHLEPGTSVELAPSTNFILTYSPSLNSNGKRPHNDGIALWPPPPPPPPRRSSVPYDLSNHATGVKS